MRTNDTDLVLEAEGLTKSFGGNAILKGVDIALHRGEVVLLQGANGSTLGRTWQDIRLFGSQTLSATLKLDSPSFRSFWHDVFVCEAGTGVVFGHFVGVAHFG